MSLTHLHVQCFNKIKKILVMEQGMFVTEMNVFKLSRIFNDKSEVNCYGSYSKKIR